MEYDEFSETCLTPAFIQEVCILFSPFQMLSTICGDVGFHMLSVSQMTWSMTSLVRLISCPLSFMRYASFPLNFLSFFFAMISKCDAYIRLALLVVVLSTHPIYPSQSMLTTLTASLESALLGVIQMSWVTLFLMVHEW